LKNIIVIDLNDYVIKNSGWIESPPLNWFTSLDGVFDLKDGVMYLPLIKMTGVYKDYIFKIDPLNLFNDELLVLK